MKNTRTNANLHGQGVDQVADRGKPIDIAGSRRARLMGASALAGGALRGLAIAAGMATVFGAAPAFALDCQSGTSLSIISANCDATATGGNATAVGSGATATGASATAY